MTRHAAAAKLSGASARSTSIDCRPISVDAGAPSSPYELDVIDGEDALRPVTGSGLGILRADRPMSAGFAKLPPTARVKAREKHLLVLTFIAPEGEVDRPEWAMALLRELRRYSGLGYHPPSPRASSRADDVATPEQPEDRSDERGRQACLPRVR